MAEEIQQYELGKSKDLIEWDASQSKTLYEKIELVKETLGELPKDAENKVGAKGSVTVRYTSLSTILRYINPLLRKYKLSVVPSARVDPEMTSQMSYTITEANGQQRFIRQVWYKGRLRVTDLETGYFIDEVYDFPMDDNENLPGIKAAGSTLTYARRYMYSALFDIVSEDEDPDALKPRSKEELQWYVERMAQVLKKANDKGDVGLFFKNLIAFYENRISKEKVKEIIGEQNEGD